jgi:hypothetical protein
MYRIIVKPTRLMVLMIMVLVMMTRVNLDKRRMEVISVTLRENKWTAGEGFC